MKRDNKALYEDIMKGVSKEVKKTLDETICYGNTYMPQGSERYTFYNKLKKQAELYVKISWSFVNNDGNTEYDVDLNDKNVIKQFKKSKTKGLNCHIDSVDRDEYSIWHYMFCFSLFVKFDDNMNIIKYDSDIDRGPYKLLDPVDLCKNITKILDNYTFFKRYIKRTEAYKDMMDNIVHRLGTSSIVR